MPGGAILGGHGPMFSAGHDMGSKQGREDMAPGPNQHPSATVNGGTLDGAGRLMVGTRRGMCGMEYFARRIASVPTMAALLIKESVNQSVDQMGFCNALNACFSLHKLNHAHWAWMHDSRLPMGTPGDAADPVV